MKYIKLFEEYNDNNDYYNEDDEEYGVDVPKTSIDGTYYHGTTLRDGEFINRLEVEYSDHEALWFSWEDDVSDEFADNYYNEGENIKIIFEVYLKSDNIADLPYELTQEINDFYGYEDFRESIPMLHDEKGFDGWKTMGSIGSRIYDDIAIFDESLVEIKSCKLFIGGDWTDYMPLDEAEELYTEWYEKKGN